MCIGRVIELVPLLVRSASRSISDIADQLAPLGDELLAEMQRARGHGNPAWFSRLAIGGQRQHRCRQGAGSGSSYAPDFGNARRHAAMRAGNFPARPCRGVCHRRLAVMGAAGFFAAQNSALDETALTSGLADFPPALRLWPEESGGRRFHLGPSRPADGVFCSAKKIFPARICRTTADLAGGLVRTFTRLPFHSLAQVKHPPKANNSCHGPGRKDPQV